jgi:hypothetical protein
MSLELVEHVAFDNAFCDDSMPFHHHEARPARQFG